MYYLDEDGNVQVKSLGSVFDNIYKLVEKTEKKFALNRKFLEVII